MAGFRRTTRVTSERRAPTTWPRELAQIASGLLVVSDQHEILQDRGGVGERARTGDCRLHIEEHLGDHGMLADRLSHLDALRRVFGRLLEGRRRDADALNADAEPRLVHEREDPLP